MSDSECELRRGRMANSDEQPSEPNRDHEGNLNSPSLFFIDFANKVMACAPTARTIADDFHELPADAKEKVLKGLVDEIMKKLLKGLPELGKEEFLDDCFKALYEKLPWKSQVRVADQVLEELSPPSSPSSSLSSPPSVPWRQLKLKRPEKPKEPEKRPEKPKEPEKPLPEVFYVDIPKTIRSVNGQGRGRGRGREVVKK